MGWPLGFALVRVRVRFRVRIRLRAHTWIGVKVRGQATRRVRVGLRAHTWVAAFRHGGVDGDGDLKGYISERGTVRMPVWAPERLLACQCGP